MRIAVPAALLLLAGCAAPAPRVVPPAPIARPAPVAVVPPAGNDWRDWPVTPGDWRYRAASNSAVFGTVGSGAGTVLALTCDRPTRSVTLAVAGPPQPGALTVRTSSVTRALPVTVTAPTDGRPANRDARLAANDPLLDAMGFSRGRFVIEQAGAAPLVVPAWAEILRVTEDCRG